MKGSFKGWKKISSAKDHSIMRNEAGHELKISHSGLSPKLRGQLAEIPVHGADESGTGPASARKTGHNKGKIMMSEGGMAEKSKVSRKENIESIKNAIQGGPAPAPKPMQPGENVRQMQMVPGQVIRSPAPLADPMNAEINRLQQQSMAQNPDAVAKLNAQRAAYFESLNPANIAQPVAAVPAPVAPVQPQVFPAMEPQNFAEGTPDGPIKRSRSIDFTQVQDPSLIIPVDAPGSIGPSSTQLDFTQEEDPSMVIPVTPTPETDPSKIPVPAVASGMSASAGPNAMPTPVPTPAPTGEQPTPASTTEVPAQTGLPTGQQSGLAPGLASAASDPYGTKLTARLYEEGMQEELMGIKEEAAAVGAQGRAEADIAAKAANSLDQLRSNYQGKLAKMDEDNQKLMQAFESGKIDPNRYLGSMDTGQKIGTAFGLILGGLAGGMTGQENPAMKFINQQIDRDIDAQKANLGKTKSLLEFNMQKYGILRDAEAMTRADLKDMAALQGKAAAARLSDPIAKSRALQAAGKFKRESAAIRGQQAMKSTIMEGVAKGQMPAEKFVEFFLPKEDKEAGRKEIKQMKEDVAIRDHTLEVFDRVAQLQKVSSRVLNPLQSKRELEGSMGVSLESLTKNTAGRVTPETVHLMEGIFAKMGNNEKTNAALRAQLNELLTQKMQYSILPAYGFTPELLSRYNQAGASKYAPSAPVRNPKKK